MSCSPLCDVRVSIAPWIYFIGFLISVVVAWVLRDYGAPALDFSPVNECLDSNSSSPDTACLGRSAVMRISLGNLLFFAAHLLLCLGVRRHSSKRLVLHTGLWPLQFMVWGGLIGSTFAMPNSVFSGYGQAARVFSAIFILLQLVILLDFVYWVNEWLLEREHCAFVLVGGAGLMVVGSFVGLGFLYKYYAPSASCGLNIWFLTSTIIFFLVYAGISVSPLRNESAGLFTSAAVFAYCTYYVWSALNSEPPGSGCVASSLGQNKPIQITAFVLALIAVAFTTTNSGTASAAFDVTAGTRDEDSDVLPYRPDFFHLIFLLASAYMAMVLTGWDLSNGDNGEFTIDRGWGSTWVKISASWLCALLYTWSLVAHRILSGRQF